MMKISAKTDSGNKKKTAGRTSNSKKLRKAYIGEDVPMYLNLKDSGTDMWRHVSGIFSITGCILLGAAIGVIVFHNMFLHFS